MTEELVEVEVTSEQTILEVVRIVDPKDGGNLANNRATPARSEAWQKAFAR